MIIIELLKAVIYGILEGVTEWLPVSSTGHLILLNDIMPMKVSPSFWNMFLVVIQLGAILAVVLYFWKKIWPFNIGDKSKPVIEKNIFLMWIKIVVACIPAAVVGILFDDYIDKYLYKPIVVAIMLILVGVAFIVVETKNKGRKPRVKTLDQLTFRDAIIIGLFQLVAAIFPGTSRSGATIIGGLLIGVSRTVATEFTFFLAIPVMFGASLLKLLKFGFSFTIMEVSILLVGMIVAFVVSIFVIRFLMSFIKKHNFKIFGWYRILLGLIVIIFFAIK